jgi:hypothetical protein
VVRPPIAARSRPPPGVGRIGGVFAGAGSLDDGFFLVRSERATAAQRTVLEVMVT